MSPFACFLYSQKPYLKGLVSKLVIGLSCAVLTGFPFLQAMSLEGKISVVLWSSFYLMPNCHGRIKFNLTKLFFFIWELILNLFLHPLGDVYLSIAYEINRPMAKNDQHDCVLWFFTMSTDCWAPVGYCPQYECLYVTLTRGHALESSHWKMSGRSYR